MRDVWISRLGHALPGPALRQQDLARWIEPRLRPGSDLDRFRRFFARAGVERRHSVLDLFGGDGEALYPAGGGWADASVRSRAFARHALPLALAAVRAACPEGVPPITHVVVATCTGAVAPGLDVQLVQALDLGRTVRRTLVGFMGCYAAIPALRVAWDACRADPAARVLVVCCELSSLHFQPGPADDAILASGLFGDGAAAAVVESCDRPVGLGLRIAGDASQLIPDTTGQMAWEAGPNGFVLRLSPSLSRWLCADLGGMADALLAGRPRDQVRWAVHPGGPRIIAAAAGRLGLGAGRLDSSVRALAEAGNRSSGTILAIVHQELAAPWQGPLALLAFGPGLTAEGLLLERCA